MQSLHWYVNRFRLMSFKETAWRAGKALRSLERFSSAAARRAPAPTCAGRLNPWPAPVHASPTPADANGLIAVADRVVVGQADLFGQWIDIGSARTDWNRDPVSGLTAPMIYGPTIDYRDAALVGSARNVWEINRHFQLVTLGQAWASTGAARFRQAAGAMIESWLAACPYPIGINWISALEHGIRLINWYMGSRLLGWQQNPSIDRDRRWLDSIYWHCRFIDRHQSRYSSANNHLIGEMAGLYIAACVWPCWRESESWRRVARSVLIRESELQVHADGVGCEQTTGYQMFVLQFLIIAGLVGEEYGQPFPAGYWERVRRMIAFLRSISDIGGHLPDFGDSDDGVAFVLSPEARTHRLHELLSIDSRFSELSTASAPSSLTQSSMPMAGRSNSSSTADWLLSGFAVPAAWPRQQPQTMRAFSRGGYFVLGSRVGLPDEAKVVFDAGPLGFLSIAAHGHADCLSFVLSVAGEELLIDPGTYCYHSDPAWRNYFRSTAAHNTVRVDAQDQSEMAGLFMWMRKAQPTQLRFEVDACGGSVGASHDGYAHLGDPVIHRRELRLAADVLTVEDHLECAAAHDIETFWHMGEACEVSAVDASTWRVTSETVELTLKSDPAASVQLLRGNPTPGGGWISRRFGTRAPTTTLLVRNRIEGATMLRTVLSWKRWEPRR